MENVGNLMSADESVDGKCKESSCRGELERFEHRPEDGVRRKDQKLCKINRLPIDDHLCIAECIIVTRICTRCRLVHGPDVAEHHPERGEWTKQDGKYTRKGEKK